MAKPIDASTLGRVIKFFPMLSSDQAGDVVNAAAAITRVLKAAGNDWHDLAARIEAGNPAPSVSVDDLMRERERRERERPPQYQDQATGDFWSRMKRHANFDDMAEAMNPQAQRDTVNHGFGRASRNSKEHRAKKQTKTGGATGDVSRTMVDRGDLLDVINGIDAALGGKNNRDELGEQAFSMITGLEEKASRYSTVGLTIRQDDWLCDIARRHNVPVSWEK